MSNTFPDLLYCSTNFTITVDDFLGLFIILFCALMYIQCYKNVIYASDWAYLYCMGV